MKRLIYLGSFLVLLASLAVSASDARPGEIKKVEVFPAEGEVRVEITLSTIVTPSVETAQHPDRLVVKLPGTASEPQQKRIAVQQYGVKTVRFGLNHPNPPETHLVVDLDEERPYQVTTQGTKIILLIQPSLRAQARQRNAPAAAASKPLISSLGRGKSADDATLNSQTNAQGALLTPPPSGPAIQFPQPNSADSSGTAGARAAAQPPSARRPNRAGLQEGTVFPSSSAPGAGEVPPVVNAPQAKGLDTGVAQDRANAKAEAPAKPQPLPEPPRASSNASPESATSIRTEYGRFPPPALRAECCRDVRQELSRRSRIGSSCCRSC